MIISLVSDLHLASYSEYNDFFYSFLKNDHNADVLILAGDIITSYSKNNSFSDKFFGYISTQYRDIFYVLGNYEYYHSDLLTTKSKIKKITSRYGNICVLENDEIILKDTQFIFSPLWSEIKARDDHEMEELKKITDFNLIRIAPNQRKITIDDLNEEFSKNVDFIIKKLKKKQPTRKTVIVTHGAPSYQSENLFFYHSPITSFFCSDLEYIMEEYPHIKYWIHGHCHNVVDYKVVNTRVISNSIGYLSEIYTPKKNMIIEV